MPKTITQRVVFKNATTGQLYELYMNAKKHSAATHTHTKITNLEGTKYAAGDGYITGRNLLLQQNRMIVQTWRASDWDRQDEDSILILSFQQSGKHAILNMVHAHLPDRHAGSIKRGWTTYYWNMWKDYLQLHALKSLLM